MLADFNRMLFRKVKRGVYYTAALYDEIRGERLHLAYIGEGATPVEEDTFPLDILAVGDWKDTTIEQLRKMVQHREVKTVIFPEAEGWKETETVCRENGVETVQAVQDLYVVKKARWELRFQVFSGEQGESLVMYQGFTEDNLIKEDCVFSGKIMDQEHCVACLYGEDDYCGFGCLRTKDFDLLKGHKRSGNTCYRMGTVVLGNINLKAQSSKLIEMLKPVANQLRCIYLPYGVTGDNYDDEWLKLLDRGDYLYVIGQNNRIDRDVVGKIVTSNPYIQYRIVNEQYGFCASGYRIPYLKEKSC